MRTNEFGITPGQQHPHVPHLHMNRKAVLAIVAAAVLAAGFAVPATRQGFTVLTGIVAVFGLYFLPTLIAEWRHARNTGSIFVVNLLLTWTVIGWIVALAMALADTHRPPPAETPR